MCGDSILTQNIIIDIKKQRSDMRAISDFSIASPTLFLMMFLELVDACNRVHEMRLLGYVYCVYLT